VKLEVVFQNIKNQNKNGRLTLLETGKTTCKWMAGRRSGFPFGAFRPIFRYKLLVSERVC